MGKTVPSYRMALEDEIQRWSDFSRALRAEEKEAFDQIMDACRNLASAAGNATQPILFEPMTMSIMLHLQLQVSRLEKKLNDRSQQPDGQAV